MKKLIFKSGKKSFKVTDANGNIIIAVVRKKSREPSFEMAKDQMKWFVDWYNYNEHKRQMKKDLQNGTHSGYAMLATALRSFKYMAGL